CGVLFTEGVGVYLQKRWAEFLMIFATAALIPLEIRHVWHRLFVHGPVIVPALILLANCFIVWFLYMVLRRVKPQPHGAPKRELAETREVAFAFGTIPNSARAGIVFSIGKPTTLVYEPSIFSMISLPKPCAA